MADYARRTVLLREIAGIGRVETDGVGAIVNGQPANMTLAAEIRANRQHYMAALLAQATAKVGDVAAIISTGMGSDVRYIIITTDQMAAHGGAAEVERYAAWRAGAAERRAANSAAARAYDAAYNEGGEGYNPYR